MLILAFGSVLCVEGVVLWLTPDSVSDQRFYPPSRVPELVDSIAQWQTHHLLHAAGPQDVLLHGDSSCLMGLRPLQLMEQTDLEVWNAGTFVGIGVSGHVRLLDAFVRRHGAPRLVVYHVTLEALARDEPRLRLTRRYTHFPRWLERLEAGRREWLPSLGLRPRVQAALTPARFRQRFLSAPRGRYPSDDRVRSRLLAERGALSETGRSDWAQPLELTGELSQHARHWLPELFARAGAHDVPLLFMLAPLPEAARTRATLETFAALERELAALAADAPGVTLHAPLVRFYPSDLLATKRHLTDAGARRNTSELSTWLAAKGLMGARKQ